MGVSKREKRTTTKIIGAPEDSIAYEDEKTTSSKRDKKKKKKDKKNKRTRGRTTTQIIGAAAEPVLSTEILSDAKDTVDLHTTMDNIGQEEFGYDASVAYDQGAEKSKKAKKD